MVKADRPHPFDLIFGGFRDRQFPAIRDELGGRASVDEFVLTGSALELLAELRPDTGLDQGIDDFVALVHAAYRYWLDGERTIVLDAAASRALCEPPSAAPGSSAPGAPERTKYIQIAPRLIWAELTTPDLFEPLDGWFALLRHETVRMVACFGVHAERPGLSAIAGEGPRPSLSARPDGTALFTPVMPGGDLAGLHAIVVPEELLLLGWRAPGE